MNYRNDHLENKEFSFVKELIFKLALAICIILFAVVVMVYGFKFQLYNILSDSQAPYFKTGDMIFVQPQKDYEVGDIIKFSLAGGTPVTHRLIAKVTDGGKTYYICHGDNVQNTDKSYDHIGDYEWEINRLKDWSYAEIKANCSNIQEPQLKDIDGKVVGTLPNYGRYFTFIRSHAVLMIGIVGAIWCLTWTVQNEIDMKRERRMVK